MSLFLLIILSAAHANSVSVTIRDHLLGASVQDAEDPTAPSDSRLQHMLSAEAESGNFGAGVEVSGSFSNGSVNQRPLSLEKKHLTFSGESLRLDVGDSTHQLGRGIALDLYRDDVFGIHNTLEGATVRYDFSQTTLGAFGGRVSVLASPVAVNPVDNTLAGRTVVLVGSTLSHRLIDGQSIGAHYFSAESRSTDGTSDQSWHTVGLGLDYQELLPNFDLYLEPNIVLTNRKVANRNVQRPNAYGTYLAATSTLEGWRFKFEIKDYRNYDFEFRRPPTLEEDIIVSLNNEDISAARAQVERRMGSHSVSGSFLSGYDRVVGSQLYHGVVGTKLHLSSIETELKAGYRIQKDDSNLRHIHLKTKLVTVPGQSVELLLRKQAENKNLRTLATVEDRNIAETTYNLSPRWSVGLGFELVPTNPIEMEQSFLSGSLAYRAGDFSTRAFMGSTNGGSRCSGGVCRRVPPFSGAMLEAFVTL